MEILIGREAEIKILHDAFNSPSSEFLAIYGRRRIGKTFFIRKVLSENMAFYMTGASNATTDEHLSIFYSALQHMKASAVTLPTMPHNWFEAFELLKKNITNERPGKKVIFFDELPWIARSRSKFLTALEHFWNSWASARQDIFLIVSGSATSWITGKILNNHGGLHNRVTQRINLSAFTLKETEAFLKAKNICLSRYQILEIFMVLGGIPFYLDQLQPGRSSFQEIDRLAFSKNGLLRTEYNNLYHSIFKHPEQHIAIIETLATKPQGLTREKLIKGLKIKDGGSLSKTLNELSESGFIGLEYPYKAKRKNTVYRITDPYSLFYHKFLKDSSNTGEGSWLSRIDHPGWRAWSGYAFETICYAHMPEIKKALGISGVYTQSSSWVDIDDSIQIDLLLERKDKIIHLCEVKFSEDVYVLSKEVKANIQRKISAFRMAKTPKQPIFPTLITTYGLKQNIHSQGFIQNVITMDDLFDSPASS